MHIWRLTSIKTVHPSAEKGAGGKKSVARAQTKKHVQQTHRNIGMRSEAKCLCETKFVWKHGMLRLPSEDLVPYPYRKIWNPSSHMA